MYEAAGGNATQAARMYHEQFPRRDVLDSRFFTNLHRRLRDTGTFAVDRTNVGRRAHPAEERILEHFDENSRDSTRSAAQHLGIHDHTTVWRALNRHGMHPYHFERVKGLLPQKFEPRAQFSEWFIIATYITKPGCRKNMADKGVITNIVFNRLD